MIRFELREWQPEDADSITKYANNDKIARNMRNLFPHPFTIEHGRWYADTYADKPGQCVRAIVVNSEAVGAVGAIMQSDIHCKSAELGYWLGEPFWNNGIMSSAIKQLCSLVFAEYDIVRIYAEVFAYNTGSRKALEKAGFQLEGVLKKSIYKNDQVFDSYIYALTK